MKYPYALIPLAICSTPLIAAESEYDQDESVEKVIVVGKSENALTEPSLEAEKLFDVPGAEGDPLQAIFSLPGVLFANDSEAEPAVRGSAPEDNVFLVDSMPAGNIYHPFGFSIFNNNVINDFKLLPAAYPAQYSDATGAVFDITLRDPRVQDISYMFEYSFLKTGFMTEGQIADGHAFYFSYRRSLLDIYFDEADINDDNDEDNEGFTVDQIPEMSDYQGKYVWNINDNNKFSFLILGSQDDFKATIEEDAAEAQIDPDIVGRLLFDSSFDSQVISWNSTISDTKTLNMSFGHLKELEEISLGTGQFLNLHDESNILKLKYAQKISQHHEIIIGAENSQTEVRYSFDAKVTPCSDFEPECFPDVADRVQDNDSLKINGYVFYIQDQWQLSDNIVANIGINSSNDNYLEEQLTEPRASIEWEYAPQWKVKFSTGKYHRTPDGEQIIRVIGNPKLRNFKAKHYTLGFSHENESGYVWNLDLYYKDLYDLPLALSEEQSDTELNYSNDAEGEAYGVELLVEKHLSDKWYGWLAMSLARSERTDLREQKTSKFTGDTPAVINCVLQYQLNDSWSIGFRYTYRTGAAYTPITGLIENPDYPDLYRPVYGELNSKRLPNYQRLDVRAEYQMTVWGKEASLVLETINLTNHENISGYSYDPQATDTPDSFTIEAEESLTFFPSVGFKMTF